MKPAIIESGPNALATSEWGMMKEQAGMLVKSGFLPPSIRTAEQALALALTGRELGIGMMESIRGINVIQNKPAVSPQLMLALARRTGQLEHFAVHAPGKPGQRVDHSGAECHVKRKGEPTHVTFFGPKEAEALGLMGKDNYKKQPGTMYQWRAVAANLRVTFPDAISGLYTPEELGAEVVADSEGAMTVKGAAQAPISIPQERPVEADIEPVDVALDRMAIEAAQRAGEPIAVPEKGLTDAERRRLLKLAEFAYGDNYKEALKGYLKSKFNVDSPSELETDQYTEACIWLKDWGIEQGHENVPN